MARLPRLYAPNVVQHVLQRPVPERALFTDADDYALFVALLADAVAAHSVQLHAYVLMPSQVRLLATPSSEVSIPRAMQAIGRRYVPYLNRKTGRDGRLWDRRYRSTLIDADRYLLAAMRHVERLPVEQSLVIRPDDWRWSSHAHHVGTAQQPFIHDHPVYWALSDGPFERQAAYRRWSEGSVDDALSRRIEATVETGWALGEPSFRQSLTQVANRRSHPLGRGRPRKVIDLSPISGECRVVEP